MKGILKIYHPEETVKYSIKNSYCKSVYSNMQHFLEVEITTDDSLDQVEDDSLQYDFPQISFTISDFPVKEAELAGKIFLVNDAPDEIYSEVDLYDDEEAFLYDNELSFQKNSEDVLEVIWKGTIDDFYTGSEKPIPFKLKCHFKPDEIEVDED